MTHSSETVDSDKFVLSIGGLRIAVRTTGSGDPVLLLNGMSRPMKSWTSFAGALRDRTVIAFDAPGVGASETPVVPYSMPMLSDVAARVLDAVGVEKADVVGYSHGGAVAQQFAVGHPTRVNRLVLLATACGVGAVPGRPSDVTQILLTPNRGTRWPPPHPLGLLWQILAISTWSSIPFSAASMCPPSWSAATMTRPSRRQTAGCWRRASPTPASSRSRTDTICRSPVRQPLWPNWWISCSIRKLRLRTRNTGGQVGKTLTGRTPAESGLLSKRNGHIGPARHSLLGLGNAGRLAR